MKLAFPPDEALQTRYLWLFAFCYATVSSLIFQKLLLPALPSLHYGSGLLKGDAAFFHQTALLLAENIRAHGWSVWSAYSSQFGTAGNVAVLSALYAVFPADPALIISVNALLQASSAVLLLFIGRELWPGRTGNIAGLVAAVLFVVFPSSLSWYSQPLKDCYVNTGMLMILYSWLRALRPTSVRGGIVTLLVWMFIGILLLVFVKPYYLRLLLVLTGVVTCGVFIHTQWIKHPQRYRILSFYLLAIFLIVACLQINRFFEIPEQLSGTQYQELSGVQYQEKSSQKVRQGWQWEETRQLPGSVEKDMQTLAQIRVGMIEYNQNVNAGSTIDADVAPHSATGVLLYFPRALQISLFAPFPDTWLQKLSPMRLVGVCETMLWYLIAPGMLLALYYRRTPGMGIVFLSAAFFMTILGFVTPNVGTLYRYRYVYEAMLMVVACGGWTQFFLNRTNPRPPLRSDAPTSVSTKSVPVPPELGPRTRLMGTAAILSLMTLIGLIGFLVRDLLMARWFGASAELDAFFLGSMLPMFIVAAFSIPAGTALIPTLSAMRDVSEAQGRARLIGAAMIYLSLFLAVMAVLLHFLNPFFFSILGTHFDEAKFAAITEVMNVYLLILLLSGWVVIANAALNAAGITMFPALAQLVVPMVVIVSLVVFGTGFGIRAAVYGMLVGQIANLALVAYALNRWVGIPPRWKDCLLLSGALPLHAYFILVASALTAALYVPVANVIAAQLPQGSVAIISLGIKVVLLMIGVIGAGMATVLLPYFSTLVAKLHHHQARSDLSYFLVFVTLLSVPATLVMVELAEPMVSLMFGNGKLTQADMQNLTKVIQYGVIQLPFFTCGLVALKFITAYGRTGIILFASLTGLVLMFVLGTFAVKFLGLGGVSLSMTLSMAVSTAILVAYANYLKHLPMSYSIFILFNWVAFITLFLCLHYHAYLGVVISGGAYMLMVFGSWRTMMVKSAAISARHHSAS